MLSDTEFEDKVRQAGCFPTLLQLGWMRWAFDLGVELAKQQAYLNTLKGNIPGRPGIPTLTYLILHVGYARACRPTSAYTFLHVTCYAPAHQPNLSSFAYLAQLA